METCEAKTRYGRCLQTERLREVDGMWLCPYHLEMALNPKFKADEYYHQKIVSLATVPTADYISQTEMDALMRKRPKLDGRRLDQWTL